MSQQNSKRYLHQFFIKHEIFKCFKNAKLFKHIYKKNYDGFKTLANFFFFFSSAPIYAIKQSVEQFLLLFESVIVSRDINLEFIFAPTDARSRKSVFQDKGWF